MQLMEVQSLDHDWEWEFISLSHSESKGFLYIPGNLYSRIE